MNRVIKISGMFSCIFFLFSCTAPIVNKKVDNSTLNDITLMPFYAESGYLGYINAETLEIIIPGQYEHAGPFTGGFAVVSTDKDFRGSFKPKFFIINKNNETVLSNFNDAFLFTNEEGNITFALTANHSGLSLFPGGANSGSPVRNPPHLRPEHTNYRLYNLNTGKLVIKKDTRWYSIDNISIYRMFSGSTIDDLPDDLPRIMTFSNYILYDNDLYEFYINGALIKSDINIDTAVSQIVKERKLNYKENIFHYNLELFFDPYFRYFDNLDLDLLFESIPDDMGIRWSGERGDWRFGDEKVVLEIEPINRNKIHPFKDINLLYSVQLLASKGNGIFREYGGNRYAGPTYGGVFDLYMGLYDASNNGWVIPPTLGEEFFMSGYDDWIILKVWAGAYYTEDYYNIMEKKVYKGLYGQEYDNMTYYGYRGYREWAREVNIKDF
jgi:hypothetical protein